MAREEAGARGTSVSFLPRAVCLPSSQAGRKEGCVSLWHSHSRSSSLEGHTQKIEKRPSPVVAWSERKRLYEPSVGLCVPQRVKDSGECIECRRTESGAMCDVWTTRAATRDSRLASALLGFAA
jgi:hypothetical protein